MASKNAWRDVKFVREVETAVITIGEAEERHPPKITVRAGKITYNYTPMPEGVIGELFREACYVILERDGEAAVSEFLAFAGVLPLKPTQEQFAVEEERFLPSNVPGLCQCCGVRVSKANAKLCPTCGLGEEKGEMAEVPW